MEDYRIHNIGRKNRSGGGVALIAKSQIDVKLIRCGQESSFEYGSWSVTIKNKTFGVIGVSHAPYSSMHPYTNITFIDEIGDLLSQEIDK